VGFLLVVMTWQQILQAGLPLTVLLGLSLLGLLWNIGGSRMQTISFKNNLQNQLVSLRKAIRGSGLLTLLTVSALWGMGTRALFLFIPLYLAQNLKMGTVGIGFHMSLITFLGIASGPIMGTISDRMGRKPMIVIGMFLSSVFPLLILKSGTGIGLTISIALFGLFFYSENSLIQAAGVDLAEGMKLEGTLIGMLSGNIALFGSISPIIAGALAGMYDFQVVFYYAAAIFLTGGLLALRLPLHKIRQP
jgi:MFS family permease